MQFTVWGPDRNSDDPAVQGGEAVDKVCAGKKRRHAQSSHGSKWTIAGSNAENPVAQGNNASRDTD